MIQKINQSDNFIAQSLEHFFKLFLLLIDNQMEVYRKKVLEDSQIEKNEILGKVDNLNEKIKELEELINLEKEMHEKEILGIKQKSKEDQEIIGILKRDLDDVSKKLADSQSFENADKNVSDLMKSVNSFNNFLEKIEGENVKHYENFIIFNILFFFKNDKLFAVTNSVKTLIKMTAENVKFQIF